MSQKNTPLCTVPKISKKAGENNMDKEFTGPFPRYSGAITAVTNGAPEDINEMPASLNHKMGYTSYESSDLPSPNPGKKP